MNIGDKLKNLRKVHDLTLEDISKRCGVGKATLSRIENNITAGTLRTHMKICEALNTTLKDLYEGIEIPQEEISALGESTAEETEVFSYDEKTKSIILTKSTKRKNMLPQLIIIDAGGKTHIEQNIAGTDKFIYCTEGQIQIIIEEKAYDLKKGMSLYFNAALKHRFINIGKNTAKCLVVTSPVAF